MKKLILTLLIGLGLAGVANATLWDYYNGQLPSVADRSSEALQCGISDYTGTYDQNIKLENCLRQNAILGLSPIDVIALYEDSLQSSISNSATTMTLVRGTDQQGTSLNGTFGFIIDEGTTLQEFVIATCSGVSCSAMKRGVSVSDGNTEVAALKFAHRRGATIKMTDYPVLGRVNSMISGKSGLNTSTPLFYDGTATFTYGSNQLVTWDKAKDYTDTVGAGGFTSANVSTTRGLSVDGSAPERVGINASSTTGMAFGSDGKLYQKVSSTAGLYSDSNGIGINYASNNTWTGINFFATTTIQNYTINASTSFSKFGGNGEDGDLTITSGTTTIDLGGAKFFTKNYNNLTINGSGALEFSNPSNNGTVITIKVKNNWVVTSTANPAINLSGLGATNTNRAVGFISWPKPSSGATAGEGVYNVSSTSIYNPVYVGSGGQNATGGISGGRGGGALYFEVNGNFNNTSNIWSNGINGAAGSGGSSACAGGAGGSSLYTASAGSSGTASSWYAGGGGGGTIVGSYNVLIANSGIYTVDGGGAGTGSFGNCAGGGGSVGYYNIFKNTWR